VLQDFGITRTEIARLRETGAIGPAYRAPGTEAAG
jgi:itaconate CoA-transferase